MGSLLCLPFVNQDIHWTTNLCHALKLQWSVYRRCDITCLKKMLKGQTSPGTTCTLIYDKKPSNVIFCDISRNVFNLIYLFNIKALTLHYIHLKINKIVMLNVKYKMYKVCIHFCPAGNHPGTLKITQVTQQVTWLYIKQPRFVYSYSSSSNCHPF